MSPLPTGLLSLFLFSMAHGLPIKGRPPKNLGDFPVPLSSSSCASALTDESAEEVRFLRQILDSERVLIAAVPEHGAGVLDFLARLFPDSDQPSTAKLWRDFESLWRRIPEVAAPDLDGLSIFDDASIVAAWGQFKSSVETLPNLPIDLRRPGGESLRVDERVRHHLESVPAEVVAQIVNLPWEPRLILDWMRGRTVQHSVHAPGWGDRAFDSLWRELFGVQRPWSVLGRYDAHQAAYKDKPFPRARVLLEWRHVLIFLHKHLARPPDVAGETAWVTDTINKIYIKN